MSETIPFGEAAFRIGAGVTWRHLSELARRNRIPYARSGHIRVVRVSDLPLIRAECERAGYTRTAEAAHVC